MSRLKEAGFIVHDGSGGGAARPGGNSSTRARSTARAHEINARRQFRILHAEGVAALEIAFVDDLVLHEQVELEIREGLEEDPSPGFDLELRLARVLLQRVQAVGAAMPVRALALRDRIVGLDQAHLHRDLARSGVRVGHDHEEAAGRAQPAAYARQGLDRTIEVLQGMHQENRVVYGPELRGFDRRMDEAHARRHFLPCDLDQAVRGLDHGEVAETLRIELGRLAFETAQLQRPPVREERRQRAHHVTPNHLVEIVGVSPGFVVLVFLVVVSHGSDPLPQDASCSLSWAHCIFRKSPLRPTTRNPNFVYRPIAGWLSCETSRETVSTCSARARSRHAASSLAATPRRENSGETLVFVMKQERARASM